MRQRRKEFGPRLRLFPAVGLVFALLSGAFWVGSRAAKPSYERFVSKPLPDGTRYTFRYPSWMGTPSEQAGGVYVVGVDSAANVMVGTLAYLRGRSRLQPSAYRVAGIHALYQPAGGMTIRTDARTQDRWERNGRLNQTVRIKDRRTQSGFSLTYNASSGYRARFEESEPVIAASFHVLPPGTPVPSP